MARTDNQKEFIKTVTSNEIVLCHGPAGCGKTHIACGLAVAAMKTGVVDRIVICRPVIGVGKDIGYLPGTLEEKMSPMLAPIYDELGYYVEQSLIKTWLAEKKLEVVPLYMMRGRTFNNSFVILDEAQNALLPELRMFMTRLGQESRMVLVGDVTQSDLPVNLQGAFKDVVEKLHGVVATVALEACDIVRNELIAKIEERLA